MNFNANTLTKFIDLFPTNSAGHGCFTPSTEFKSGQKREGKYLYTKYPASPTDFTRHLLGEEGIGVSPLMEDSTCAWGVIDIDVYTHSFAPFVRSIWEYNTPFIPVRSKSGGLHLYIFFESPRKASEVRVLLKKWVALLGLKETTEVFPKQDLFDGNPSWINLPYFGDQRHMLNERSEEVSLEEFLNRVGTRMQSAFGEDPFRFRGAPPCVTAPLMWREVPEGERQETLFNCAVYLRLASFDSSVIIDLNNTLNNPLPEREISQTLVKAIETKSHFYKCKDHPHCSKRVCQGCEFGISSSLSTGLDIGELRQCLTIPPYYEWDINGRTLTFSSESALMRQSEFQALCIQKLGLFPRTVKQPLWEEVLEKAIKNMRKTVAEDDTPYDEGAAYERLVLSCYMMYEKERAVKTEDEIGVKGREIESYVRMNMSDRPFNVTHFVEALNRMEVKREGGMLWITKEKMRNRRIELEIEDENKDKKEKNEEVEVW